MRIHTVGDSHSHCAWPDYVIPHHLGAILCYSFGTLENKDCKKAKEITANTPTRGQVIIEMTLLCGVCNNGNRPRKTSQENPNTLSLQSTCSSTTVGKYPYISAAWLVGAGRY